MGGGVRRFVMSLDFLPPSAGVYNVAGLPDFPAILRLRDDARLRPHSAGAPGRGGEQAGSGPAVTAKSRQG